MSNLDKCAKQARMQVKRGLPTKAYSTAVNPGHPVLSVLHARFGPVPIFRLRS